MIIVSIAFTCLCRRLQESDQQNREMMAIAGKKEETIQKLQVNTTNVYSRLNWSDATCMRWIRGKQKLAVVGIEPKLEL